jgi:hypothetical protein
MTGNPSMWFVNIKRKALRNSLAALAVIFVTFEARAEDLPNFSVERWCSQVSKVSGDSAVIYGGCIEQEQNAYDELKQTWATVPSKARSWCEQVARSTGPGSFVIFKGCIDQEAAARQENTTRQFKR